MQDACGCRLCLQPPGHLTHFHDQTKVIRCFGPADTTASTTHQTVADVLNKHFWFELLDVRDRDAFVCAPCWGNVSAFHRFYQSVWTAHAALSSVDVESKPEVVSHQHKANHAESSATVSGGGSSPQTTLNRLDDNPASIVIVKHEPPASAFECIDVAGDATAVADDDDADDDDSSDGGDDDDKLPSPPPPPPPTTLPPPGSASPPSKKRPYKHKTKQQNQHDNELLLRHLRLECEPCALQFRTHALWTRHNVREHRTGPSNALRCCDRRFTRVQAAIDHCALHENPNEFDCTQCDQTFRTSAGLQTHTQRLHPVAEPGAPLPPTPVFLCPRCPNTYSSIASLRSHTHRVHTAATELKYECYECHRRFAYLSALRSHLESHAGSAPFVCAVCAALFKTRGTYNRHYAVEHAAVAEQCPECGRWLKHRAALQRHAKLHRVSPPACAECGHQAAHERAADAHRRRVHGRGSDGRLLQRAAREKVRHECMVCGKEFARKCALTEHMSIHMDTDLYKCPYCPETFRFNSFLYTHRKRVHAAELEADRRRTEALMAEQRRVADAARAAEKTRQLQLRQAKGTKLV